MCGKGLEKTRLKEILIDLNGQRPFAGELTKFVMDPLGDPDLVKRYVVKKNHEQNKHITLVIMPSRIGKSTLEKLAKGLAV
jgi:hypothetical protein